jgi:hypothetical protein
MPNAAREMLEIPSDGTWEREAAFARDVPPDDDDVCMKANSLWIVAGKPLQ